MSNSTSSHSTEHLDFIDLKIHHFWGYLLDNYPWYMYTVVFPFVVLVVNYFLGSLFFYLLEYWITPNLIKKYKIQKSKKHDNATLTKAVKYLLFAYFVVILPMYVTAFYFLRHYFLVSLPVPSWKLITLQLLFCLLSEDFFHYWFHRWEHTKWAYENIHYLHHEFQSPSALSATYAHPLDIIIQGTATFSGPLILNLFFNFHMLVLFIWVNLRQFAAIETHCGFEFPFSPNKLIPYCGGADFHDYHHRTYNGAYSSNFVWWDIIFGTDKGYFEWKEKQMAKEKKKN